MTASGWISQKGLRNDTMAFLRYRWQQLYFSRFGCRWPLKPVMTLRLDCARMYFYRLPYEAHLVLIPIGSRTCLSASVPSVVLSRAVSFACVEGVLYIVTWPAPVVTATVASSAGRGLLRAPVPCRWGPVQRGLDLNGDLDATRLNTIAVFPNT